MFSVIMACYNAEPFLSAAIDSVKKQTFPGWELIIVDDGSYDGTWSICREARAAEPRIRALRSEENVGAAAARNLGIRAARGRYITFLDSDDIWYPEKLARQYSAFTQLEPTLLYSWYDVVNESGRYLRTIRSPPRVSYRDLRRGCPIGCLTAAYDRGKVGTIYMPDIAQRQDWGLWLRILATTNRAIGLQEPLAALRVHKNSMTANKVRSTYYTWRLLRSEAGLGIISAASGLTHHLLGSAIRRVR